MSLEQKKATVRRVPEEVFNTGNLALADELIMPDYVEHAVLPPGFPTGLAGLKMFITGLRAAFPDFRYTVEDAVAEGDRVVVRLTAEGTHQGDFLGVPATGRRATWSEMHWCRLVDGKLAEHWVNIDELGMLRQLGVIPTPAQAAP